MRVIVFLVKLIVVLFLLQVVLGLLGTGLGMLGIPLPPMSMGLSSILHMPFHVAGGFMRLGMSLVGLAIPVILIYLAYRLIKALLDGRESGGAAGTSSDDARLLEEVHRGLEKMDKRIDTLETILLDRMNGKKR
jgi:phage shock protein B